MIKILLATPCSNHSVSLVYLRSIEKLLKSGKWDFEIVTRVSADLAKCRNAMLHQFMLSGQYDYLFFVDSDMGFEPELLIKMINANQSIVGALCPRRWLDKEKYHKKVQQFKNPQEAWKQSLNYVCENAVNTKTMRNGLVQIKQIGTGLMLLQRDVPHQLRNDYPELISGNDPYYGTFGVHQPFMPLQLRNGNFLSEDLSFCQRWTDKGGDIWAVYDQTITHAGYAEYTGSYADRYIQL